MGGRNGINIKLCDAKIGCRNGINKKIKKIKINLYKNYKK